MNFFGYMLIKKDFSAAGKRRENVPYSVGWAPPLLGQTTRRFYIIYSSCSFLTETRLCMCGWWFCFTVYVLVFAPLIIAVRFSGLPRPQCLVLVRVYVWGSLFLNCFLRAICMRQLNGIQHLCTGVHSSIGKFYKIFFGRSHNGGFLIVYL